MNQYEREFNLPDQRTDYSPLDGGPSVIQEGSETVGNKELGSTKSPDRLLTTRQSQSHSDEKAGTTSRGVVERRKGAQPVAPWRGDRQLIRIEGAPPSSSGR